MRENVMRGIVIRSAAIVTVALVAAACTGGVGTPGGVDDGFESFPGRRESPGAGRETPPPGSEPARASNEPPARGGGDVPPGGGGGGPGALQCSGEYSCVFTSKGEEEKETLRLALKDGVCSVGKDTTFDSNGTVTTKGQSAGTWRLQGDGTLVITLGAITGTCTPKK